MAKLYFKYGAMNASKSADLLMTAHRYEEQGKRVLCFMPAVDTRSGHGIIKSRLGIQREAISLAPGDSPMQIFIADSLHNGKPDCVLADEIQFLTRQQIEEFADIVDSHDIPVILYGLKTNFRGELFEGAKRAIELADKIEEIKTVCWYCEKKATFNMRVINGMPVYKGPELLIGGNDTYRPVCRYHYKYPPTTVVDGKEVLIDCLADVRE